MYLSASAVAVSTKGSYNKVFDLYDTDSNVDVMLFYWSFARVQADFLSNVCGGTSSWHSRVPKLSKHAGNVTFVESYVDSQSICQIIVCELGNHITVI